MRILLIITAREVGGAEVYVERLMRGLHERADFTIALSDHPRMAAFQKRLQPHAKTIALPVDRLSALPGVMGKLNALAKDQDLIQLNSNHPGSRLGIAMGFGLTRTRPRISVEHRATPISDIQVPGWIAPALPTLFRWSRRGFARVVAVAKENARCLQETYGLPANNITVVNNGVDILPAETTATSAPLRQSLGLDEHTHIVLVLARLMPNKGHRFLIDAAPAILRQHPNTAFVFAGHEDDRAPLDAQIDALNLRGKFFIIGQRDDVPALLQHCDVFVLPSLAEGFALSIIEALAAGCIVVATWVGGAEEAIVDGVNGILVPPANATALGDAISRALAMDDHRCIQMKSEARRSAQRFSVAAMCDAMWQVYQIAQTSV